MALSNDGKWFNYVDQSRLYADTTSPNLDTDLQANIANELEISYWEAFSGRIFSSSLAPSNAFKGVVIGNSGTLTSTGAGNVTVAAVTGYVSGRRTTTSAATSLTLSASKTYYIYLKVTDSGAYSISSKSWPGEIVALESSVAAPAYSVVLATVVTNPSNAVTLTDQRFRYEPSQISAYSVDSNPQSTKSNYPQTYAYSLSDRLDMIVTRIANILGSTDWLNNITSTASLTSLNAKFGTAGHSHTGVDGQGPKLASNNITYTGNFDGVTQSDVDGALDSLYSNKLSLGGADASKRTMTAPLTLSANPTSALHAVTKQYVDGKLSKSMQTGYLHRGKPVGFSNATGTPPTISGWTVLSGNAPTTSRVGQSSSNDGQTDGGISITTNIPGQLIRFITPEPLTLRLASDYVAYNDPTWWDWFVGLRVYFRVTRDGNDIYNTGNPSWATSIDLNRIGWSTTNITAEFYESNSGLIGTSYSGTGDTIKHMTYLRSPNRAMYQEKINIPDFYDAPAIAGSYLYKLEAAICNQDLVNGSYDNNVNPNRVYPIQNWESQLVISFDNTQGNKLTNQQVWHRTNLEGIGMYHMVPGTWIAIVGG